MSDNGFEHDRHRDEQPERDDLIDPDELDTRAEEALRDAAQDPAVEAPRTTPDMFPDPEALPETQDDAVDEAASRDDVEEE